MSLVPALLLMLDAAAPAPTPRTMAALPLAEAARHGAAVPFDEYEAENAVFRGTIVGPDRTFGTIAAEASGRRAVRLDRPGDYVEFTLARPADSMVVRAAIPDDAAGRGIDATLHVQAGDRPIGRIGLTSRYGWYYGRYPFTNDPRDGRGHHMFDEARLLFGRLLPAGARVRLTRGEGDTAAWYAIDLADFEQVGPPRPRPAGSLSVVDFGADPSGQRPSSAAFEAAIAAAQARHTTVWIPPGTFLVDRHLIVDRVRVAGAGPWYSVVRGPGVGLYGKPAPGGSTAVRLEDFAIIGEVTDRVDRDQVNGVGGAMGGGSLIRNLWIQHTKVGLWFDGPMRGIRVSHVRILDTAADGLNFAGGVHDAIVDNVFVRGSGDDGLAAWSRGAADDHVVFRHNTVIAPVLANGIALYGGHDLAVDGNLVADTLTEGGGLHLGNRFDAVPASGRIRFTNDLVVRSGSADPHLPGGIGALWLYALDAPIAADVTVRDVRLAGSTGPAVQFTGEPIRTVSFDRLAVDGAGGPGIVIDSAGAAVVRGSRMGGVTVLRCHGGFDLRLEANAGPAREASNGC